MIAHGLVLHSWVSEFGPKSLQSFPPLAGGGLVQALCRVCFPPPQGFEHAP